MSVYFIQAGEAGPIKIGHAQNPRNRVKELQTGAHDDLRIIAIADGSWPEERAIHASLKEHQKRGEWFHPHEDVFAEIDRALGVWDEGDCPAARRYGNGDPVLCPFCGKRTLKLSWTDHPDDDRRCDFYCDNSYCDVREIACIAMTTKGDATDLLPQRADVTALRILERDYQRRRGPLRAMTEQEVRVEADKWYSKAPDLRRGPAYIKNLGRYRAAIARIKRVRGWGYQ